MNTNTLRLAGFEVDSACKALSNLAGHGVTPEDIAALGSDEKLSRGVADYLKAQRMFSTPAEQVEAFLKINEQVWKDKSINPTAIRRLGGLPDCPVADAKSLPCPVLVYQTGNWMQTLKRNFAACCFVHGADKVRVGEEIVLSFQGVRLRPGARPRQRGLQWVIVDLGRKFQNLSASAAQVEISLLGCMDLGLELPLIAALHPRWATLINGKALPALCASDLEIAPNGRGDFTHNLLLDFHDQCIEFSALDNSDSYLGCGAGYLY